MTTSFNRVTMEKTGKLSSDGDTITWTVTIHTSGSDISDWTLKDTFNGAQLPADTEVTISGPNGLVASGVRLPYTFTANSNADSYTITYTTQAEKGLGMTQAVNWAELTPPDGSPGTSGGSSVDVGSGSGGSSTFNPLSKQVAGLTENKEEGTVTIGWTVTIDATEGDIPADWTYADAPSYGQYFTAEQLDALQAAVAEAVKELGWSEKDYEFSKTDGYWLNNQALPNSFKLVFHQTLRKGAQITFTYYTTASMNSGGSPVVFLNSANVNNTVWANDRIEYTPPKLVVTKVDGNGGSGETSHNYYDPVLAKGDEQGYLKWIVRVNVPSDYTGSSLTVKEKLPAGVELDTLTMQAGTGAELSIWPSENSTHGVQVTSTGAESDSQVVTIEIPQSLAQPNQEIVFRICAKIQDSFEWSQSATTNMQTGRFTNEVDVIDSTGTTIGKADQTQTIVKDDGKDVLIKRAGATNSEQGYENNVVPYSVIVNPNGETLLNGEPLELVDQLKLYQGYTAALVHGSVHVYRWLGDHKGEELPASEAPYIYEEGDNGNPWYLCPVYTLTFTLPDSTPLCVEYSYKISGQTNSWPQLENTASLKGNTSSGNEVKETVSLRVLETTAGANITGLILYKVKEGNYGITLDGAEFELYKYNGSGYVKEDSAYVTQDGGKVVIAPLTPNTAYKLVEVKAPEGYMLDSRDYYFYVSGDEEQHPSVMPEGFSGYKHQMGDALYYPNTPNTTSIEVVKQWRNVGQEDVTEAKVGAIGFDLYQVASTAPPSDWVHDKVKISGNIGLRSYDSNAGHLFEPDDKSDPYVHIQPTYVPAGSTVQLKVELAWTNGGQKDFLRLNSELGNPVFGGYDETWKGYYTYTFIANEDVEISGYIDYGLGEVIADISYIPPAAYTIADETTLGKPAIYDRYSITAADGWKKVISGLPSIEVNEHGDIIRYYTYYVEEVPVNGYDTSYSNNEGIAAGTITIINQAQENPGYELPETGGAGIKLYTVGGAVLVAGALTYKLIRRRKKEGECS